MKKANFSYGDKIRLTSKKGEFLGILIPSEDKNILVIKLENGYNIGLNKNEILSINKVNFKIGKTISHIEYRPKKGLKKVCILHTGGTIASRVDYETGAVTAKFKPEEIINMFPEVKGIANIDSRLLSNMASDHMRFAHYNIISKGILKEIKNGADGIIITHGTDTLTYTAAALSFALAGIPIPVALVGSQRSSDRPSSDAALNLISAAKFLVESNTGGIYVVMHNSTNDDEVACHCGTRVRKNHTSKRNAFQTIGGSPAYIVKNGTIEKLPYPATNMVLVAEKPGN